MFKSVGNFLQPFWKRLFYSQIKQKKWIENEMELIIIELTIDKLKKRTLNFSFVIARFARCSRDTHPGASCAERSLHLRFLIVILPVVYAIFAILLHVYDLILSECLTSFDLIRYSWNWFKWFECYDTRKI